MWALIEERDDKIQKKRNIKQQLKHVLRYCRTFTINAKFVFVAALEHNYRALRPPNQIDIFHCYP